MSINGTNTETIGERPSTYSLFRRSPDFAGCYVVDIDFVEFRAGRGIVAVLGVTGRCKDEQHLINCKPFIWERTKAERKILMAVSDALHVHAYYVIHTEDLSVFHVHDLVTGNDPYRRMTREEYIKFTQAL